MLGLAYWRLLCLLQGVISPHHYPANNGDLSKLLARPQRLIEAQTDITLSIFILRRNPGIGTFVFAIGWRQKDCLLGSHLLLTDKTNENGGLAASDTNRGGPPAPGAATTVITGPGVGGFSRGNCRPGECEQGIRGIRRQSHRRPHVIKTPLLLSKSNIANLASTVVHNFLKSLL